MGVHFQPDGQFDATSINEVPKPCIWISKDVWIARLVFATHPFNIGHPFKLGNQFSYLHWHTCAELVPAIGRRTGFLTLQSGGRHLATGHTINSIVYKNKGYIFTPVAGMDGFCRAYGRQISITLI